MKKKLVSLLLAQAILVTTLSGCGASSREVRETTEKETKSTVESSESTVESSSESSEIENESEIDSSSEIESVETESNKIEEIDISKINNTDKSAVITDNMYKESQENVIFSPLSLNMALGLLSEAAEGETKDKINEYLDSDNYSDFAKRYIAYSDERYNWESEDMYSESKYKVAFEIANSVWLDNKYNITKEYASNVKENYDAEIDTIDVKDNVGSADKINSWCNEKTREMIPEIIQADNIKADTLALLINSVYFESPWIDDSWNMHDETEKFTKTDGTTVDTKYMYNTDDGICIYENDKADAFSFGYLNDMEFIGILPKEDGEFNLADLDIDSLISEDSRAYYDEKKVKMPKLNFDSTTSLTNILKSLGLDIIFSNNAELNNIVEEDVAIKVDDIIQKTKIELDENGTKASAVTAIMLNVCSAAVEMGEPTYKEIYLDRPFAFVIYDRENSQIAFMGKVVDTDMNMGD